MSDEEELSFPILEMEGLFCRKVTSLTRKQKHISFSDEELGEELQTETGPIPPLYVGVKDMEQGIFFVQPV